MTEEEKKPGGADNRKKKFYGRFAKGVAGRSTYKSKVQGLEKDTFNVEALSNPAKFSKLLKNIENYIHKTYKDPDDMVKTMQKMKRVILKYPEKPKNIDVEVGTEGEDLNQGENIFVQKKEGGVVNKNWVLLDSQSTANQVANPGMLTNRRQRTQ
jgi:hypothetical protein